MRNLSDVPAWRREPYRILFPLGALLAWAGVLHWFLYAVGLLADYKPIFHAITQIQGFMMCFAVGFLFTAIPRRTGTAPPGAGPMIVAIAAPVGTTVAAWYERWETTQLCWLALLTVLAVFAVRRFVSGEATRRPPNCFIWIPLSFGMGLFGSILTGVAGALGERWFWMHDLGKLFTLQGMFVGLVIGVGGMVLPLLTRGEGPPDAGSTPRDRLARLGHTAAALLLSGTFWIENAHSQRWGLGLRAVVTLVVLLVSARIDRPPSVPGWHRCLIWLSAWMIPAGYTLAAVFPLEMKAGLHLIFIGSFALMAFSVGLHVTLAHGGYTRLVSARLWQVPAYGGLFLLAAVLRTLVDFDRSRFFLWLALSAASFLLGTLAWGWLVVPRLLRAPRPDEVTDR